MTEKRMEDTELWKTIQKYKEVDRKEEEQKRQKIIEQENKDPFRKIPEQVKYWIEKYLKLSGIQRNEYNQIVDKFKRLSMSQIRGILREVHGYNVSEEMLGKFKKHLIENGELLSDKEIEAQRPSEEELRQIRKEGARATSIERSKEKTHLDKEEVNQILEGKKNSEDVHSKMRKLKEDIEEHGYCPTDSEEQELEKYEED
jgi:hypothetical protein